MRDLTIGIIGLGLIGGSIAKALRAAPEHHTIIAYNRSEKARLAALEDGTADLVADQVDDRFSDCDYIFLCTPVEHNLEYLSIIRSFLSPKCIITDVGSVKGNIHAAIEKMGLSDHFIGGHPMAGSEKTGYDHSDSHLLENAFYALTPTKNVRKEQVDELFHLVRTLGAIPVLLDATEHDYAVAAISHVPHLIAATLVNLVKQNDSDKETMKLLAAGGFKDITRIASSSPDMWQQICSTNRDNIVTLLDQYIRSLEILKNNLLCNVPHCIYDLFECSRAYRDSFSDRTTGLLSKVYAIYCDIIDESGAISTVAGILAKHGISIKNIGIVNNRERDAGVLRIEFENQKESEYACRLLSECGYRIYFN